MIASSLTTEQLEFAYITFAAFITPIAITIALVYWRLYNKTLNDICDLNCEIAELKAANKDLKSRLNRHIEEECMTQEQRIQVSVGKAVIDIFKSLFMTL